MPCQRALIRRSQSKVRQRGFDQRAATKSKVVSEGRFR
jgi:hypothetical protein